MRTACVALTLFAHGAHAANLQTMDGYSLSAYSDALAWDGNPAYYWAMKNPDAPQNPIWYVEMTPCSAGCYNEEDCVANSKDLPAGKKANEQIDTNSPNGGIGQTLWDDHKAHLVKINCMSQDAGMGDTSKWGLKMKGAQIIKAVFQDAVATHGLGNTSAGQHLVIFGGSSGSAITSLHHLPLVPGYIGNLDNVHVVGLHDSGSGGAPCAHVASSDWSACNETAFGNEEADQLLIAQAEWQYVHDEFYTSWFADDEATKNCAADQPSGEEWNCIWPEYKLAYATAPHVSIETKFEKHMYDQAMSSLTFTVQSNQCTGSTEVCERANEIAGYHETAMLNAGATQQGVGFFWGQCYVHSASKFESTLNTNEAGGTVLYDALMEYFYRGNDDWTAATPYSSQPNLQWGTSDSCNGFSCGTCAADCGGGDVHPVCSRAGATPVSPAGAKTMKPSFWAIPQGVLSPAK